MTSKKHMLSMLMENEAGALSRVAGLFSARGYNIQELNVAPTEDESLSRLTLITEGDDRTIEQIVKHLNRLIDVVKVVDLMDSPHIERDIALIKVRASGVLRDEIFRLVDIFRAAIVDTTQSSYIIQIVGDSDKIQAFLNAVGRENVIETVRSGSLGIQRGEKCLCL